MKPGKVRKSGKALSSLRQKGIKITGKWKPVSLDPSFFTDGKMDEMICFEELTGYKLVKSSKELTTRKRKRVAGEEDAELEDSEEHFGKGKKSKKRKKKLEAKRAKEKEKEESEDELEDVFLGGEEGDHRETVEKEEEVDTEPSVETMAVQTPKKKKKKKRQKKKKPVETREEPVATKSSKKTKNWAAGVLGGAAGKDVDVSAWKDLCAPEPVLQALSNLGFSAPTPIQALALPSAIRDKLDILGAAETGSGKTLAFAIPMIHSILEWRKMRESGVTEEMEENEEAEKEASDQEEPEKEASDQEEPEKEASDQEEPEKEASDQVEPEKEASDQEEPEMAEEETEMEASDQEEDKNMNKEDEEDSENDYDDDESSALGCVKIVEDVDISFNPVTSNTSQQCCNKRPLLGLVVTPTRELAVQVKHHIDAVAKFTGIRTAIVVGGMAPQKQERLLNRRPEIVIATPGRLWEMIREKHPHLSNLKKLRCLVIDEADRMVEKGHYAELTQLLEMLSDTHYNPKRQTFVFSATLTLIHQAPSRLLQKKNFKRMDKDSKLEGLMQKVGMKGKPKVIDLTRKQATVETLTETRIHCSTDEKDFYLYYFLLQYPGRTMVFANSIDCIKRLTSLLTILECNPLQLHANMHQKQRLRNLERFAERESCVLLTTDVAARGLDIPNIQHVLHYQVPRTSETYVHRSGRTARASSDGLTLLLIGPDDVVNYRKIFRTLEKNDELPFFPVESKCMNGIKERVSLARQIEKAEYFNSKTKQQNSWIQQAAEALEMDIDDDLLGGKADEEEDSAKQRALKFTKKQLKRLLSQPIFRNILKTKYPTKSGQLTLPDLPAARAESALHTLSNQHTKKRKPRP